jgi:hypothetical protein
LRRIGELGLRPVAEAHPPRAAAEVLDPEPERGDGDVVVALMGEDAQLGRAVSLEGAVAVEMVGGEVEQHGALGRELDGVLELEGGDLADDGGGLRQPSDERAQRRADVAGHRDRPPRLAVDVADELGRRRLAVGAGDRDELVVDQPPRQLDLAQHRQPALARRGDDRSLRGHPGRLDHRVDVLERRRGVVALAAVDAARLLATGPEDLERGHARARQPDHEPRAGRQRRAARDAGGAHAAGKHGKDAGLRVASAARRGQAPRERSRAVVAARAAPPPHVNDDFVAPGGTNSSLDENRPPCGQKSSFAGRARWWSRARSDHRSLPFPR